MSDVNQYDENNERHGEWFDFHDNGKLWYRTNYIHGFEHGLEEGYHPNGKLWYRGYRNMDKQVGYWYWYGEKKYYLWLI